MSSIPIHLGFFIVYDAMITLGLTEEPENTSCVPYKCNYLIIATMTRTTDFLPLSQLKMAKQRIA